MFGNADNALDLIFGALDEKHATPRHPATPTSLDTAKGIDLRPFRHPEAIAFSSSLRRRDLFPAGNLRRSQSF